MTALRAEMTPKERVLAALRGQAFDVYPAITPTSVVNYTCMQLAGSYFPQAHTDARQITDLAATAHTVLGFDTVMPYFSVHLEAELLGCKVDWGSPTRFPSISARSLKQLDSFSYPSNILSRALCRQYLSAIRLLKKYYGDRVAIIGKVLGPWSLLYNLYGVEHLLLDVVLEPKQIHSILKELIALPIAFANAQLEAGADLITWAEHVTSDLISPGLYEEFMLQIHRYARQKLPADRTIILHTCGNVMDRLDLFCQTGFDLFHLDSRNDILQASALVQGRMRLTGGINNPGILAGGDPEAVCRQAHACIRSGLSLVSPECAIPLNITNASLQALTRYLHSQRP